MTPTLRRSSLPLPFSRFFAEQSPAVAGFLRGMLDHHEAEECLQETFIAALRAYDRFDGENPRAWVLAIARSKAIDGHRAGRRRPQPSDGADQLAATPDPGSGLDSEIWAEVTALPEKQRAALVLRYALDLRYREIGVVLGCSEPAARRSAHEGISKLRQTREQEEVA
jgi:RNA polymerase sigma factor (sigma-70 family)